MPTDALRPLVRALLSHLPEDPSSAVIVVKPEVPAVVPTNGQNPNLAYDPAAIYLLEMSTTLALRDDQTVKKLGGEVAEALQNVVRDATTYHPTMISRSAFYLLSLLHASYVRSLAFLRLVRNADNCRTTPSFVFLLSFIPYQASKRTSLTRPPSWF